MQNLEYKLYEDYGVLDIAKEYGDGIKLDKDKKLIAIVEDWETAKKIEEKYHFVEVVFSDEWVYIDEDEKIYRLDSKSIYLDEEECKFMLIKGNECIYIGQNMNKFRVTNLSLETIQGLDCINKVEYIKTIEEGFNCGSINKEKLENKIKEYNEKGYDILFLYKWSSPFDIGVDMVKIKFCEEWV